MSTFYRLLVKFLYLLGAIQVCGETHACSYFHIFIVTVVIPIIATLVLVLLASLGFVY